MFEILIYKSETLINNVLKPLSLWAFYKIFSSNIDKALPSKTYSKIILKEIVSLLFYIY